MCKNRFLHLHSLIIIISLIIMIIINNDHHISMTGLCRLRSRGEIRSTGLTEDSSIFNFNSSIFPEILEHKWL